MSNCPITALIPSPHRIAPLAWWAARPFPSTDPCPSESSVVESSRFTDSFPSFPGVAFCILTFRRSEQRSQR